MTTEQKALALLNKVRAEIGFPLRTRVDHDYSADKALCRAIEAHEADNARWEQQLADQAKAFSDAAVKARDWLDPIGQKVGYHLTKPIVEALSPFILPEPDPLQLAIYSAGLGKDGADEVRQALAARGWKMNLERIEQ